MRIELYGGPMDGDRLPEGWQLRPSLFVVSKQQDAAGHDLAHVYLLTPNMRFDYEGLHLREGLSPLVPLRIGERL